MYHEIAEPGSNPEAVASWTVSPSRFESHLRALESAGYTGVSVADWLRGLGGERPVVLTFDDGCAGDIRHALPILAGMGWTATFFVISGRMGAPGYAAPADWKAAAGSGMEVGSHTATHPFMGALAEADAERELRDSKAALEEAIEGPVSGLSWPNGDAHPMGRRLLARAGYSYACTSRAAFAGPALDTLDIPRLAVRSWHDAAGLAGLIDASLTNRARMALVWRAKTAARALLGRKRYADIQMGFRDDA
jgi:peptidoglycan/xylan/chitin deacetylase (PgdA/CDA1 family)